MKYLVTVQAHAIIQQVVEVEAATEKEAGLSATQIVIRSSTHRLVPGSFDVLIVKENPRPEIAVKGEVTRAGYMSQIL